MNYIAIKLPGDKWFAFPQGKNIASSKQQLYESFPNVLRLFHIPNVEDDDEAVMIAKLLDAAVIDLKSPGEKVYFNADKSEVIIKLKLNGESWREFKDKTTKASMGEYLRARLGKGGKDNISALARQMRVNRKTAYRLMEKYKENLN